MTESVHGVAWADQDGTKHKIYFNRGPKGEKGDDGQDGVSVTSVTQTAGTHAAGTTDTYTITLSDGSTFDFYVYNGANGEGCGDFVSNGSVPMTGDLQMGGNKITGLSSIIIGSVKLEYNTSTSSLDITVV